MASVNGGGGGNGGSRSESAGGGSSSVDAMKPLLRPGPGGLHLDSSTSGFGSSGGSSTGGVTVTATIQSSSSHNSRQHQVRCLLSYSLLSSFYHKFLRESHIRRRAHLLSISCCEMRRGTLRHTLA